MRPDVFTDLIKVAREVLAVTPGGAMTRRLEAAIKAAAEWDEPRIMNFGERVLLSTGHNMEGEPILCFQEGVEGPFNATDKWDGTPGVGNLKPVGSEAVIIVLKSPEVTFRLSQALTITLIREATAKMETRQ